MRKLIAVIAALLACALLFAGCGKDQPNIKDAPGVDLPEGYDEPGTQEFSALSDALQTLADPDANMFVRKASTAEAFVNTLQNGNDGALRLSTAETGDAVIPAGDYSKTAVVFDAPNMGVVSDAALGDVLVEAVGEAGLQLHAGVKSLTVTGENVTVTLGGGAEHIYVQGKNCTLRLESGSFGSILSVNQTVVIENATDTDVTVYMANGAPHTLAAGETLSFD